MTEPAEAMKEAVAFSAADLKAAGFSKRRYSFNRNAGDGLVHVVHFWMAPKEPPAWNEVPGLRERLYGNFRIDTGVYVPEMNRSGVPRSSWVNEYDCQLRFTVGQLLSGDDRSNLWWSLSDPESPSVARTALNEFVLPWLDTFPDRESVVSAFEKGGPFSIGMSPAGGLDIADLLFSSGDQNRARQVLEQYVARPVLRSHASVLTEYLEKRGHSDLIPRIQTREPT